MDKSALIGIALGLGMLLPAFFVGEGGLLAVPGFSVLLPSLIVGMR